MRFSTHIIKSAAIAILIASPLNAQDQDGDTDGSPATSRTRLSPISFRNDAMNGASDLARNGYGVPCDSCGAQCGGCDSGCCQATWEFRASWLMWRRDLRGSAPVSTFGPAVILTTMADFDSPYEPGFELNARRRFGNLVTELNYFQVDSFGATATGIIPGLALPFSSPYDSALHNFEWNFLTDTGSPFRLLAGFRYISYEDTTGFLVAPFITSSLTVDNNLYGGQIGAELDLYPFNGPTEFFNLRAFAKFGVFGQNSSASALLILDAPIPIAGSSANDTVWLSEAGITGGIQVTRALSIDLGYRVLYLDDVALAGDTGSASNIVGGTTTINTGHVLFHGFNLGATLTY